MYRSIYYNPYKRNITLGTWETDGERIDLDIPFDPYIYIESETSSDAMSIFNTKLVKKAFKTSWDRDKYVKSSGLKRIFYNIPPEQQFLIDHFGNKNADPKFSIHPLRISFIDIETYSPNGFPNSKYAPDPINVITIYDSIDKHFYTWGTGGDFDEPSNVTYYKCTSESDMLIRFLKYWKSSYPDIVTGWNSEGFDIPYLINRINNILGEDRANVLSPVGKLYCNQNVITKYGKREDRWYIKGLAHLDYLNVYKKFTKDKRERYSLDFIGELELKLNKKPVPSSDLPAFANNDWQGFCEYNIQDVNIVVELEEKLHFLQIARKLAYMGYTNFEQSTGTIAIVTGAMTLKALDKGMIIPTFHNSDVSNYEGGFVREPQRGLIDSIVSFDANSLYPNTIISANISPETKLGKVISKTDDIIEVRLTNGKIYPMPKDKFFEFVKKEEIAVTKANILYSQKRKGFCPELLDGIYKERVQNQKQLKKHKADIKHCKLGSDKYNEHKIAIVDLDVMQYTLKILMNSLYGTFGNKHSPFYDIEAAASVTLTGQSCIKEASNISNEYIKQTYGIETDCTVYGDTDSLYITIDPILKILNKKLTNDNTWEPTKDVSEISLKLEQALNAGITKWALNTCNIKDPRFVFKREKICNSGLFLEKKRYILHVIDDEGLPPDEEKRISYTGVEVVSIKIPKRVKPLIKEISRVMLETRDYKKTNEAYMRAYEKYMEMPIEDIATPTGINNYEKYESISNGFTIGKHTPGHNKAAILYNYMLRILNLTKKYEKIQSGDDIKTFYVTKNKYDIKGIAFKDRYPPEFGINIDRTIMFNKNITPAVQRLYDAVGWRLKNPTRETECDLLDFLS